MVIIWRIVAFFKRLSISSDITNIKTTHKRACSDGDKIGLLEKNKVQRNFSTSKTAYLHYIDFCKSKNLPLTERDHQIEILIEETDDSFTCKSRLDWELKKATRTYNKAYDTLMISGDHLLSCRTDAMRTIDQCEKYINTLAKHTKSFDTDLKEISINKKSFKTAYDFGVEKQKTLKTAAKSSGAGLAAGTAVASMAPTAAMWVATTFGTASTGTAISALSGAAATNAALAWLGGGALASGGAGMAAGQALLALAGPVGWGIAGASIFASALLVVRKFIKNEEMKKNEILTINNSTEALLELKATLDALCLETEQTNIKLQKQLNNILSLSDTQYDRLSDNQKYQLGVLVNNTKTLSALICKVVGDEK